MLPIGGLGCCGGHVPMGIDDEGPDSAGGGGNTMSWVFGGMLVGFAILVFSIDVENPMGLKKAS